MRNERMVNTVLMYRSIDLTLSRRWTTWLAICLLTFTFAHANPQSSTPNYYSNGQFNSPPCPGSPSYNNGGRYGSTPTVQPTGFGVKTNDSFQPIVKPGVHPTKEQWCKYLCKVPKIQPNNVCMTPVQDLSPNQTNENEWVGEKDQEYCNYLGKLFSFKTSGCATLTIEAQESETGQAYQIDACGLSYSPNPNSSDIHAWYFISSKTENVPIEYKIADCKTNPLVLYQMPVHSDD